MAEPRAPGVGPARGDGSTRARRSFGRFPVDRYWRPRLRRLQEHSLRVRVWCDPFCLHFATMEVPSAPYLPTPRTLASVDGLRLRLHGADEAHAGLVSIRATVTAFSG
jgi:hypothetical protein